jgi:hypothetical protein
MEEGSIKTRRRRRRRQDDVIGLANAPRIALTAMIALASLTGRTIEMRQKCVLLTGFASLPISPFPPNCPEP